MFTVWYLICNIYGPFLYEKPLFQKKFLHDTFLLSLYFHTHPKTLILEVLAGRMHRPSPTSDFGDRPPSPPLVSAHENYIVDWVKIRWIRWSQCWRKEVEYLSLQESDGVAWSMRRAPSCRKTKTHPGISRICMAVASVVANAPFTLTPGSINGFQCCQVSKRRLALCTNLVLLCLTK